MAQYVKKPVIIEAHQFQGSTTSANQIKNWIETGKWRDAEIHTRDIRTLEIPTLEGVMVATAGDYIIKGVQGEFYPCKPEIFSMTYDLVSEGDELKPGDHKANTLTAGVRISYCGKEYDITKVENYHEETKLTLSDNTTIKVRPWTELTVVLKGE